MADVPDVGDMMFKTHAKGRTGAMLSEVPGLQATPGGDQRNCRIIKNIQQLKSLLKKDFFL